MENQKSLAGLHINIMSAFPYNKTAQGRSTGVFRFSEVFFFAFCWEIWYGWNLETHEAVVRRTYSLPIYTLDLDLESKIKPSLKARRWS